MKNLFKITRNPIVFPLSSKSGVFRLEVMLLSGQFLERILIGSIRIRPWKNFILELTILLIVTKVKSSVGMFSMNHFMAIVIQMAKFLLKLLVKAFGMKSWNASR